MRIEILDLAMRDLIEGFSFYENRENGLGGYFLDTLFSDIDSLKFYGGVHRRAYKNIQRALSKRFPFAIYYTLEEDLIRVRAVVDCRKDPSWIREHLGNS
jgi:hypothetical protein